MPAKKVKDQETPTKPAKSSQLAPVAADCAYTLEQFKEITGLADAAMREARHSGLPVITIGRRGFVRGADFIAYLGKLKEAGAMDRIGV